MEVGESPVSQVWTKNTCCCETLIISFEVVSFCLDMMAVRPNCHHVDVFVRELTCIWKYTGHFVAARPSWQPFFGKVLMSNHQVEKHNLVLSHYIHTHAHAHTHKTDKKMACMKTFRARSQLLCDDSRWCLVLTSTFIVAVWSASAVKRH